MPTNEERREVAARLRERTKKPMGKSVQRMFTETLGMYQHNICWMNPDKATARWDTIVNRLADLIEPGEPKAMCVAEVKVDGELLEKLAHDTAVELTGIDRDALLALADEMEEARYDYLEADDALWRFADRVREACGEVSYEE